MFKFKPFCLRQTLLAGCAMLSAGGVLANAPAAFAGQSTYRYAIEPQNLATALRAFALRSGRDILFSPDLVEGKTTQGVQGELDEARALAILLEGSGLSFIRTSTDGFVLKGDRAAVRSGARLIKAQYQTSDPAVGGAPEVAPQAASAEPEGRARLDDIFVVARKRARSEALQEVPISATAFGAAQLEGAVVKDLIDVGRMAPNVALQTSAQKGVQNFSIRGMGVSGTTPSDEPAVGIFQDGVYWGTNYGSVNDLVDLESVELLRGPQGTLFGRNVTGGAVIVRSARPNATTSAQLKVGAGAYGLKEMSAVVNGPLSGDLLTGRLALQATSSDGYFTNRNTGADYGKTDTFLLRPSVKFTPSDSLDVTIIGEWYSAEGDPVAARGIAPSTLPTPILTLPEREGYVMPADFWTVAPNDIGFSDVEVSLGVVEANWSVLGGVLTSVSGYRKVGARVQTDFDGTPSKAFRQDILQDQDQFSTELRFAADASDFLSYTVGLYYFKQQFDFREGRILNNSTTKTTTRSNLDNDSFAAFAEADLHFTDKLTATVGVRYTEETKEARSAAFGGCAQDYTGCSFLGPRETSSDNVSPKVGLSYDLTDKQMVFASVTKGFRAGGFGLRGTVLASAYEPEEVTAYEIGYKGDLLDDRVRLNGSIYHNEYEQLQRTVLGADPLLGVIQNVFNAANATIEGAELELTVLPTDNLTLSANYGYTDASYDSFLGVANPGARKFVRVPENVAGLSATYKHEITGGGDITGRASASYTGTYYFDDPNLLKQDAYTLVDASVAYTTPSGQWTASLWGKNLTEEEYSVWGSSLGTLGQNAFPGAPLTWGVRLVGNF